MKHFKHAGLPLLAFAIAVFFSACADSGTASVSNTPSESVARKILENIIKEDSQGLIKLVSFKKTNGQSGETFGIKWYSLECEGEIECVEGGWWWTGLGKGFVLATTVTPEQDEHGATDLFHSTQFSTKNRVEKGQRKKFSGALHFQLTENGWGVQEGRPDVKWNE
jgi:hypothetical protein